MRTSKILSPVLLVVASVVAGGAFASASNANTYPELPASHSTLTRAQVQADMVQARAAGTMNISDQAYPALTATASAKTRAEVKSEYHAAARNTGTPVYQNY